jgi:cobalamin-dependent methionine synthase I
LGFQEKNTHTLLSLSLSLFIFIIIHRTTNTKQNTAKKVVSKNNNNTVAKNAALLAATIATISSSGAALADDIEDVYAATYAKGRDGFGVRSPQRQAVDVDLQRKQAAPKPKFVKPVREEAPKPAKKESSGGGFSLPSISLPSISLPSISLPSLGGDAPATADE